MPIPFYRAISQESTDYSEETEIEDSPYENVARANGMFAVTTGGGRHPLVNCFAESESEGVQPYEKKIINSVLRSTACRDNRIITKHREMTEKEKERHLVSKKYGGKAEIDEEEPEKKSRPIKISERLYRPPEYLRSSNLAFKSHRRAQSSRSSRLPSLKFGEDETYALLSLMDEREQGYY